MKRSDFIPGIWEEEINVVDFIQLNLEKNIKSHVPAEHTLWLSKEYNVLEDEGRKFQYLAPFQQKNVDIQGMKKRIFINEETYTKYIETGDRKKLKDSNILIRPHERERVSIFQPDVSIVPLYGTKRLISDLKKYLKDMDKQYKSIDWIQRKISLNRALESIEKFEEFAKKLHTSVKKPAKDSKEVVNMLWVTVLYATLEDSDIPFSFYSFFELFDIFVNRDIRMGIMNETGAQRMVDELYIKIASLSELSTAEIPFDFNVTISSDCVYKTVYRLVASAKRYSYKKLPIQLVIGSEAFSEDMLRDFEQLFEKGIPFSFGKKIENLIQPTLTTSHLFFRNYEDIVLQLSSLDLKKIFFISLNGGKDWETNVNFYQATQKLTENELDFDMVMNKFETFLKYFITLYAEYMNVYTYYYDQYHRLPFRQALLKEFPNYLIHMSYHNVAPLLQILTAVKNDEAEMVRNEKGYIVDVKIKQKNIELVILEKVNNLIHRETKKILFYRNGKYHIVLFAGKPFFKEEENETFPNMSDVRDLETSILGYKIVEKGGFLNCYRRFLQESYTQIRVMKKGV